MNQATQTSRYLPIWNSLKEKGHCRITAPPAFHARIIHAVKKRRDKDLAFLYNLSEKHLTHRIKFQINGTVVSFKLQIYSTLSGL